MASWLGERWQVARWQVVRWQVARWQVMHLVTTEELARRRLLSSSPRGRCSATHLVQVQEQVQVQV